MKISTLVLTVDDIRDIVQQIGLDELMDDMIMALTNTLSEYKSAENKQKSRDGFHYFTPDFGLVEWMPFHRDSQVTIKTVGYHPRNPHKNNLPTILSTISTYDTGTGHLLGLADATFLTALRTGAASAVASKVLAAPSSSSIGFIGCGAQAVTQLHALSRVFEIQKVWLFDTDMQTAQSFLQRVNYENIEFVVIDNSRLSELLYSVDILCTCTSEAPGKGPVFPASAHQPHLHINAVGADFPGKTELPLSILEKGVVIPDFIPQAIKEGECQQIRPSQIAFDFIHLMQGASTSDDLQRQLTIFDSTGWALEDDVAIRLLIDIAQRLNLGTQIPLECISDDPKNPYQFIN